MMEIHSALAALGLHPGATLDEAKAAYRRLAAKWHPDRNPSLDAGAQMQRINLAFEQVKVFIEGGGFAEEDAELWQRDVVDPLRSGWWKEYTRGSHQAKSPPPGEAQFRGQRAKTPPPEEPPHRGQKGKTVRRKVVLSFVEAAFGCSKRVSGVITDPCPDCLGKYDWVLEKVCATCRGSGKARRRGWEVEVIIPPGVTTGKRIVAQGLGGRMGPDERSRGDLELEISVQSHRLFSFKDGSLEVRVPVSIFDWMADAEVPVPTLDGIVNLRPRRQKYTWLKGHGWPVQGGQGERGVLSVEFDVQYPSELTPDDLILLAALRQNHRAMDSWKDRLAAWTSERSGRDNKQERSYDEKPKRRRGPRR